MFREIFYQSAIAMILVDKTRTIQIANAEAERLFGYDAGELTGRSLGDLVPVAFRDRHPAYVRGYFEDPNPRAMGSGRDLRALRKDGVEIPVEVGLKPIRTPEDVWVVATIVDLSLRIRAEKKFRTAFEAAPNAMLLVNDQGRIVLANDQAIHLFGYSSAELVGQPIELLVPDEVKGHHPGLFRGYVSHPSARAMGTGRDLRARKKNGGLFPVEIGLRPYQDEEGLFVISSIVDMSEIVRIRQSLIERNEELEQFTYRTSHDLKAPLITMSGLADFIAEDLEAGEVGEARTNALKIRKLSARLQESISKILELMRAEKIDESPQDVHLDALLATIESNLSHLSAENGVRILDNLGADPVVVTASNRLSQVLENLISNAIKYADLRKPERTVRVSLLRPPGLTRIEVADNGLGFPPNRISEVFGIFKRFHPQSSPGSGLGLYLVKKQVEKLGGSISLESEPGKGTTFRIDLPDSPIENPS